MRFINERRKSYSRSGKTRIPSMFELKNRTEDHAIKPSLNSYKEDGKDIALQDEFYVPIQTNADIQKPDPDVKNPEKNEQKNDNVENEDGLEVSSGGLKLPPKGPVEISTAFDMSKDEWTLGELIDYNIREIPFLVDKFIPLHTLNVLAGQSERGKSTLYTQLALAIIKGDDEFLGFKLNATHKRVLVISTEDGPIALSFRLNKQLNKATLNGELRDRLTFITNQHNLEGRIEKCLDKNRTDLIVMDAFADVFTGGDINASNSVRRYLDIYVKFIQKYGCTVLFVHHVGKGRQGNKPEKDQLLGSTGIEGKMRNVLMLSIVNDQHQLSIAKGNYVNREDKKTPLYLDFHTDTLTFSVTDGPFESKENDEVTKADKPTKKKPGKQKDPEVFNHVIKLFNEGKSQVAIAEIVGKDKSTICKYIREYKASLSIQNDSPIC